MSVDEDGTGSRSAFPDEEKFADEGFSIALDKPGILAMANAGPNTNGSQFIITTVGCHWLNQRCVAFGEVESGMEVVPVTNVAEVVWSIVHGKDLHYTVGKFAKRLRRLRRWMPGVLRKRMQKTGLGVEL